MLSKIGQTLRSLVTGDTDHSVRRPSKRSRSSLDDSDDDDIVETPAKRGRFTSQIITTKTTTTHATGNWLPLSKVAELFVRGKQSIGENSFVRSITTTASPKRLLRKISSLTGTTGQGPGMSKQFEGSGQNFGAPPPYSAAGRGIYGTGAERPAPRVGYVDMPGFYMAPPAPMQQGYDSGFKMPFNKTGLDHRSVQQHPRFSSTPRYNGSHIPRNYRTMYDKTYGTGASGKSAWGVNRSVSTCESNSARSKLAAKESIRLEEKDRYAQLLQQFTTTPLSGSTATGSFPRKQSQQHRVDETVLGSRIERSTSHDSSLSHSSKASADTPVVLHVEPNKTQDKPATTVSASPGLSQRSYVELKYLRQSPRYEVPKTHTHLSSDKGRMRPENGSASRESSFRSKYDEFTPHINRQHLYREHYTTPAQPKFDNDDRESPVEIVKVVEPVRIQVRSPSADMFETALKDSPFLDDRWIKDLHSKYSTDSRNRQIVEQEVTVDYMKEKRADLDEFLQERLKKRLSLHEKAPAVLEEKFEDEEEKEPEFIELTEEMEEMIDNALRPHPGGEVLSEGFRLQITRKDIETLAGLNWLNDEVINFYMELLKERSTLDNFPKVHAFNTFFYPKIMSGGHSAVKRWTRRVDVFAVDYILVPVHLGMHWCLSVVDFPKKQIRYFDSMGGRNSQCLQALKDYLQAESMDKKKKTFDMADWSLETVKGIPQQMNGSDCGVFTCKYAEYVSRGAEITFTQEHMPYFRRRIVYEILTKKLL